MGYEMQYIMLFVRAGLNTNNGYKPATNVPVPITCNLQRLWMKMR